MSDPMHELRSINPENISSNTSEDKLLIQDAKNIHLASIFSSYLKLKIGSTNNFVKENPL